MNFRTLVWAALLTAMLATPRVAAYPPSGQKITVVGYVLDSACLFTRNLDKPVSRECALECAAGGSPLVILSQDGFVYWPLDDKVPSQGQNSRLIKYAGSTVKVTGRVFERGGSRAIVMETVEPVPAASRSK